MKTSSDQTLRFHFLCKTGKSPRFYWESTALPQLGAASPPWAELLLHLSKGSKNSNPNLSKISQKWLILAGLLPRARSKLAGKRGRSAGAGWMWASAGARRSPGKFGWIWRRAAFWGGVCGGKSDFSMDPTEPEGS